MFNLFVDNSRLEEKILDIVLPKEIVYKEDKGESVLAPLRLGILSGTGENEEETGSVYYPNRDVITTRNGQNYFTPNVKMYFRAFTTYNSVLIIDILDHDTRCLIKKFTIKSINNDYSLDDMKTLVDEIKNLLTSDNDGKIVSLIELIRNKDNLVFEEVAQ